MELFGCEGPSMSPTINPHGEIIVIEKISHRIWGIEGGSDGEKRKQESRKKQKEWEIVEHAKFLSLSKRNDNYEPSWFQEKQIEATAENHSKLSSFANTWKRLTSGIDRGDVVVLEHPEREGTVCKRVLGLPGDIIVRPDDGFHSSSDYRNVKNLFEEDDENYDSDLSYGNSLRTSSLKTVPDGHIWVEGDNSVNSTDSRSYGSVPAALVIGKSLLRVWPLRGNAMMVRGDRPMPSNRSAFTGSTIIPAGCEGEKRRKGDE